MTELGRRRLWVILLRSMGAPVETGAEAAMDVLGTVPDIGAGMPRPGRILNATVITPASELA